MERYRYEPLQDPSRYIRLLHLLPGEYSSDLRVCIEHVPLTAHPALETRGTLATQQSHEHEPSVVKTRHGTFEFEGRPCYFSLTAADTSFNASMFDTVDSRNIAETWFEALSYTWGFKEDAFIEIQVMPLALLDRSRGFLEKPFDDDCSRRNERIRWLPIRKNVESALRHLRNERTSRTLWIDSICIDQTDMDELNVQVGKMAYIYGLAGRVIAWIGEKTPDSDLAIHTLRDLGDQLVYLKGHYWISSPQSTKPLWANPREKLPFNNKIVQAIKNFFASPYFERLWIWQEVILASTRAVVQCGQELIEWATLRRSIVRLFDQFSNFPNDLKFRYHHVLSLAVSGSDSSMFRLIRATSRQKCTDPRDKVYGILGIMDSTMQQQITPNYSHDVPRVYKDAFIAYTNTEKSLRLFGQCHLQTRKIKGPTWVPDWSIRPKKGTPKLSAYFSSLRMKTNASFPHPDLLKADGIYCGTVKRVSTQAIGHNLSIKDLDSLRPFSSEQGCSISSILIAERWFHVFAAVFCVDTTQDISTLSPTSMTIDMLRKTLEIHFDQTGGIPKILTSSDSDNLADVYLKHISGQAYGHRMITSTSGLTGLAPDGVRIGDVICVLLGCELPVILRLHASGHYQVVGLAYVHSLAYGEAFLGDVPHPWTAKTWNSENRRFWSMCYWNTETGETTFKDPRLPPLTNGWELVTEINNQNGHRKFVNRKTGETTSDDPRLTRELFESRGAKFETFTLV